MASGLITTYLGFGLASERPTTPDVPSGGIAFWWSTDAPAGSELNVWADGAWSNAVSITGAMAAANNLSELTDFAAARANLELGTAAVKNTGTSGNTVPLLDGANTWSADQIVPDEAYDATNWNGSLEVPTKNAIRDKIEALAAYAGARVKRTSDQTAANYTTATAISWQSADVDTDSFWTVGSPSRLTVPAAFNGRHANIQANVAISLTTADTWKQLQIQHRDSGGGFLRASGQATEVGFATGVNFSAVMLGVPISTGDYFEVSLKEESDTSITLLSGAFSGFAIEIR